MGNVGLFSTMRWTTYRCRRICF